MHRSNTTKRAVLSLLLERRGNLVSSGLLRIRAGVTRQAVWKSIESLREEGFPILSSPQRGYILKETAFPDLAPSWVDFLLRDSPWGHPSLWSESLPSTQEVLKQMARNGAPEGLLCLAEEQTCGRGRRGRIWSSPPRGGIYLSILARPRLLPSKIQLLNLAAGLAVSESLRRLFGLSCQLKWPNDILWEGRKICGILSETACEADRVHYAVTGIGVNGNTPLASFPEEISGQVASLLSILGRKIDRGKVVAEIVSDLQQRLQALERPLGEKALVEEYSLRCYTLNRNVRVLTGERSHEGLALSLTPEGALCVETAEGRLVFSAADVVHLRPK